MNEEPNREARKAPQQAVRRTETERRTSKTSKQAKRKKQVNFQMILMIIMVLLVLCLLVVGIKSCGSSHKTPEGVVKTLIEAYGKGKQKKIRDCYGAKKNTSEELQTEIDATIQYFQVHNPKKVVVEDCGVLSENTNYTYVYVRYNLVLEDEQEYPCISTYMTHKIDGKYYVIPPAEVTTEMSKQAATDYAKFMTENIYKSYTTAYDTFTKRNPGYEDKIAGKLK
jgi:hypothetical protein